MKVLTISLKLKGNRIRLIADTENLHRDIDITFDNCDGLYTTADAVRDRALGIVSEINWQYYIALEKLRQVSKQPRKVRGTSFGKK